MAKYDLNLGSFNNDEFDVRIPQYTQGQGRMYDFNPGQLDIDLGSLGDYNLDSSVSLGNPVNLGNSGYSGGSSSAYQNLLDQQAQGAKFAGYGNLASGISSAAGSLYGIYNARQQRKMAEDMFDFKKGMAKANYANSLQQYNTAIEDKYRSRYGYRGQDEVQQRSDRDKIDRKL